MPDFDGEAAEADRADQTRPVDDDDRFDPSDGVAADTEADPADLMEQQQDVPSDDDYER